MNTNQFIKSVYQLTLLALDKMAAIQADDIFKWIFLNENARMLYFDSNFIAICSQSPIENKPALVQVMVWRRTGDNHYLNQ